MKKLRLDLLSILFLSLLVGGVILIWGDHLGIKTPDDRSLWLTVVAIVALVLAIVASLDRWVRWGEALRQQRQWMHTRQAKLAGTTQASILAQGVEEKSEFSSFKLLRESLRREYGWRWRYRRPWLLMTGDDSAIRRTLPALKEHGWLLSSDEVLLWSATSEDGQPDTTWLKQLYKLRRHRPVDAVVLVTNGDTALPAQRRGTDTFANNLVRIAEALRWSAPVYVLDAAQTNTPDNSNTPVIGCELPRQPSVATVARAMQSVRDQLAARSVDQLISNRGDRYMGEVSARLDTRARALAHWIGGWSSSQRRRIATAGIVFAPIHPTGTAEPDAEHGTALPLWQYLGDAARRQPGRRIGWHPITVLSVLAFTVIGLWTAGMLVAGFTNGRDLNAANQAAHAIHDAPNPATQLHSLLALQQQIERYEYRVQHHAPLSTRFGLNRDADALAALWKPYESASRQLLVTPVQQNMEATLVDLAQMRTDTIDEQTSRWALDGQQALKAYLMLARPELAESAFLTPQMVQRWNTEARITPGERQDLAERLLKFYADHLKANPAWHIDSRPELVSRARQSLLAVVGQRNAQDTVYLGILNGFTDNGGNNKYPDQNLVSLTVGTDPRGLVHTEALVPGIFTREAYEGYVEPAIEAAAKRSVITNDWVLTDGKSQAQAEAGLSGDALKAALTEQYFADYADRWQGFMNSLQWEAAPTLPATIEQLKLMADTRQSPVIALMKALEYQGGAGARKDSLSDTLVAKAQDLIGKKAQGPEAAKPDTAGPLGAAFGPVLRLMGQTQAGSTNSSGSDLSLQRFLDRATALRLRLQQVSNSNDADAQARQMAQAMFQGKASELADTQAYAQLLAASLGNQWASMGDTLFVRPVTQATQTVLQPAQASLNEAWRQGIAMTWGRSFAGRYPFANTNDDASLPELTRFLRPQTGLIAEFLGTQLAGVLELQGDQWVPAANGGQALAFDPAFLKGINTLQRLAARMLTQGQPQYRFEMKPVPTPGLTDTLLTLDGQKLHYYNQREAWHSMTWPASDTDDPGTRLQWQTERAGINKNYEFGGRWGLVRMLERAYIEPLNGSVFQLTWQAVPDTTALKTTNAIDDPDSLTPRAAKLPPAAEMIYPVRYQMRTEVGQGPLEMLALRGFVLPSRIFVSRDVTARK